MQNRASIGYIPGNSVVYKLNPIVKGLICFSLILFFTLAKIDICYMVILLISIAISAFCLRIKQSQIWLSLNKILFLLIFVGFFQGLDKGSIDNFNFIKAFTAITRILGVFLCSGLYLTVSSQSELLFFWEKIFAPLKLLGLPAGELALVMVIALRFFPVMLSEIDRIKMAQIARGAKLKKENFLSSAVSLMPLLIPTLTQALIRANDLADAMEARGYRVSANRTRYLLFSFELWDMFFLVSTALVLTFLYMTGIKG